MNVYVRVKISISKWEGLPHLPQSWCYRLIQPTAGFQALAGESRLACEAGQDLSELAGIWLSVRRCYLFVVTGNYLGTFLCFSFWPPFLMLEIAVNLLHL